MNCTFIIYYIDALTYCPAKPNAYPHSVPYHPDMELVGWEITWPSLP